MPVSVSDRYRAMGAMCERRAPLATVGAGSQLQVTLTSTPGRLVAALCTGLLSSDWRGLLFEGEAVSCLLS